MIKNSASSNLACPNFFVLRRNYMSKIIKYEHYGKNMSVQEHLKGKHREHCLCFQNCIFFNLEDREKNCSIATALFKFDVENNVTTPVWECEKYKEEK
jgi:hypothetical protein